MANTPLAHWNLPPRQRHTLQIPDDRRGPIGLPRRSRGRPGGRPAGVFRGGIGQAARPEGRLDKLRNVLSQIRGGIGNVTTGQIPDVNAPLDPSALAASGIEQSPDANRGIFEILTELGRMRGQSQVDAHTAAKAEQDRQITNAEIMAQTKGREAQALLRGARTKDVLANIDIPRINTELRALEGAADEKIGLETLEETIRNNRANLEVRERELAEDIRLEVDRGKRDLLRIELERIHQTNADLTAAENAVTNRITALSQQAESEADIGKTVAETNELTAMLPGRLEEQAAETGLTLAEADLVREQIRELSGQIDLTTPSARMDAQSQGIRDGYFISLGNQADAFAARARAQAGGTLSPTVAEVVNVARLLAQLGGNQESIRDLIEGNPAAMTAIGLQPGDTDPYSLAVRLQRFFLGSSVGEVTPSFPPPTGGTAAGQPGGDFDPGTFQGGLSPGSAGAFDPGQTPSGVLGDTLTRPEAIQLLEEMGQPDTEANIRAAMGL